MDVNLTTTKRKQNITKKKHLEYIYDRKVTTTSTSHIPRKKTGAIVIIFYIQNFTDTYKIFLHSPKS